MVHDLLILVAGAVIAILVNYLTAYTSSPLAQKFRKRRDDRALKKARISIENAKMRIDELESELWELKEYAQSPTSLNTFAFKSIAKIIQGFAITLIAGFGYFLIFGGGTANMVNFTGTNLIYGLVVFCEYSLCFDSDDKNGDCFGQGRQVCQVRTGNHWTNC